MKRSAWLLVLSSVIFAADDKISRGAVVYRESCAVPYCHGPEGKAGRAPALAGRGLTTPAIVNTASNGIPNTSMPAFGGRLKPEDIEAVAEYVRSLGVGPASESKTAAAIPPEIQKGRALFFDAGRSGACGACHEIGGWGVPVSLALQDLRKVKLADLRSIPTPAVVTATPKGEAAFPAVMAEKADRRVRVYDLSSTLPVLRTFDEDDVVVVQGSSWRHRIASDRYSDAELAAISRYLELMAK